MSSLDAKDGRYFGPHIPELLINVSGVQFCFFCTQCIFLLRERAYFTSERRCCCFVRCFVKGFCSVVMWYGVVCLSPLTRVCSTRTLPRVSACRATHYFLRCVGGMILILIKCTREFCVSSCRQWLNFGGWGFHPSCKIFTPSMWI